MSSPKGKLCSQAGDPTCSESLLVFSDVHLGSDLNDSGPSVPRSKAIDDDLAALIAHYRKTPSPSADRWRLVIAGDFIDFVGMSIDQQKGDVLDTEPTKAERKFGLGGAVDHVRLKLRRAANRHPNVFRELGLFVAGGNALTVVFGNHDLELHWDDVKRDFCELLVTTSCGSDKPAGGPPTSANEKEDDLAARIDFEPWFFYREGLAYIEHGHQYDPFCATPYILAPLNPRDPKRVLPSLSDTLLRYIVRRTPGMKEYGHEDRGLWSYISWGLMLGARGTVRLFHHFFNAVFMLRSTAQAYTSPTGVGVRVEHERRLSALAVSRSVPEERLKAALALHTTSMSQTPRGVLASVMLDRLAVFTVMVPLLIALVIFRDLLAGYALHAIGTLFIVWAVLHVLLSRGRPKVDPAALMAESARELAKLFPSSFIVMGHTHVPATASVGDATSYINVGSWAEEEPDPKDDVAKIYRAARTHLVVHEKEDCHEAHLCEWRSDGPHKLETLVHVLINKTDADVALVPAKLAAV